MIPAVPKSAVFIFKTPASAVRRAALGDIYGPTAENGEEEGYADGVFIGVGAFTSFSAAFLCEA